MYSVINAHLISILVAHNSFTVDRISVLRQFMVIEMLESRFRDMHFAYQRMILKGFTNKFMWDLLHVSRGDLGHVLTCPALTVTDHILFYFHWIMFTTLMEENN